MPPSDRGIFYIHMTCVVSYYFVVNFINLFKKQEDATPLRFAKCIGISEYEQHPNG